MEQPHLWALVCALLCCLRTESTSAPQPKQPQPVGEGGWQESALCFPVGLIHVNVDRPPIPFQKDLSYRGSSPIPGLEERQAWLWAVPAKARSSLWVSWSSHVVRLLSLPGEEGGGRLCSGAREEPHGCCRGGRDRGCGGGGVSVHGGPNWAPGPVGPSSALAFLWHSLFPLPLTGK